MRKEDPLDAVPSLASAFKVSRLVVLRRLLDLGALPRSRFDIAYGEEMKRLANWPRSAGGDFYLTQGTRLSRRFARAIIVSTLEGRTLYRDAFQLFGIAKEKTFRELGRTLDVMP